MKKNKKDSFQDSLDKIKVSCVQFKGFKIFGLVISTKKIMSETLRIYVEPRK